MTETAKKVIFSQLQRFFQQFYIMDNNFHNFFGKIIMKIVIECKDLLKEFISKLWATQYACAKRNITTLLVMNSFQSIQYITAM